MIMAQSSSRSTPRRHGMTSPDLPTAERRESPPPQPQSPPPQHVDSAQVLLAEIVQQFSDRPVSPVRLATMLDALRGELVQRFQSRTEDRLDYFQDCLSYAPWLHRRMSHLIQSQSELLGEVCRLADESLCLLHPYNDARQEELQNLGKQIESFANLYLAYERDETELVFDTYFNDIGAAD